MTTLENALERVGLQQYYAVFVTEGFDTWETILDIQESDLEKLNVKLGHRRKLQRAIAEYRGLNNDRPLNSSKQDGLSNGNFVANDIAHPSSLDKGSLSANKEQKRRYRRHPKSDENAPEKPPSAYVLFSNKVRDEVKTQNLSFTEIARLVGDKWQRLVPKEKSTYETCAAENKDEYNRLLIDYKKTTKYKQYMEYLSEFRAKHGGQEGSIPNDSKRPKLNADRDSSQEPDDDQVDGHPTTFRTRLESDLTGSSSSTPTYPQQSTQHTTSLQVVTSVPHMRNGYHTGSPTVSRSEHKLRSASRTPVQSYPRRMSGPEFMDIEPPSLQSTYRHESPSTETSVSGQSYSRERSIDRDVPPERQNETQYNTFGSPTPRILNVSPDKMHSPNNSVLDHRQGQTLWNMPSLEGSRHSYHRSHTPVKTSPPPPRPHDAKFSPITQILDPNQDFGPRTLPPIPRLSAAAGFPISSSGGYGPSSPPQLIPGPESIAFRPGQQMRNEQNLNVNISTSGGEQGETTVTQGSPETKSRPAPPLQDNHPAESFSVPGRRSHDRHH